MTKYIEIVDVMVPDYCEITFKRPTGLIDKIRHPRFERLSDDLFEELKKATLKANGNILLSYKNVEKLKKIEVKRNPEMDEYYASRERIRKAMSY